MVAVGAAVDAHLRFLLHHADDGVRRVVDQQRFSDRLLVAEDVLGHLVAEEDDAAALHLVLGAQKAAAGLRVVLAVFAEDVVHADDAAVDGLASVGHARCARRSSSPWTALSSGMRSRMKSTSSMRRRIGRPGGIPFHAFVVSLGHITARFSPVERRFLSSCRFSPSPNASSSRIATVPQAIDGDRQVRALLLQPRRRGEEVEDDVRSFMASRCRAHQFHRHDRIESALRRAPGSSRR